LIKKYEIDPYTLLSSVSEMKLQVKDCRVGDTLDAKDTDGKWVEAQIREIKEGKLCISYTGRLQKKEWISKDSDRLAPKNTYTTGS